MGQGDSVLVQAGGEGYLIDAGRAEEGPNIVDFLRDRGVRALDGRKIVYAGGGTAATSGVWVMNSNGSKKKYLGSGKDPAFSPDGTRIAFVEDTLQYSFETGGYEMLPAIWTMRKDGTGRTMVIGNEDRLYQFEDWDWMSDPSWQPRP